MLKLLFITMLLSLVSVSNTVHRNNDNLTNCDFIGSTEFKLQNYIRGSPNRSKTNLKKNKMEYSNFRFYLLRRGFIPRWFSKIVKHGGCTPYPNIPKFKRRC